MPTQYVKISDGPIAYDPTPPVVKAGDTVIFQSYRADNITISWDNGHCPMTQSGPYAINGGSSLNPSDDSETVSATAGEGQYTFTVSPPPPSEDENGPPKYPEEGSSTHGGLEVSR